MNIIKKVLKRPHAIFTAYLFDPWDMLKRIFGVWYLVSNGLRYAKLNKTDFKIDLKNIYYKSFERFAPAGSVQSHYFLQDIWAARYIYRNNIKEIVDIGSKLDGYIAHLLPYCKVTFIDIRPLDISVDNLLFKQGSITSLPLKSDSIETLSCLHVIEHIGLGRYGDPVDPNGHILAADELCRVLAPGGTLLLSTPVGEQRLCFDGHRIFNPVTIVSMFSKLQLINFCLIDDLDNKVIENASIERGAACSYGCGIFIFRKTPTNDL